MRCIMKTLNKTLTALALTSAMAFPSFNLLAALDEDSATVSMSVAQFASLTGLSNFSLTTADIDGSDGAVYAGNDSFNLHSNDQVRVSISGGNLSDGQNEIATSYALDGAGLNFDTAADSVHNANHTISAQAVLGDISDQKAGGYSAVITLTVSAL